MPGALDSCLTFLDVQPTEKAGLIHPIPGSTAGFRREEVLKETPENVRALSDSTAIVASVQKIPHPNILDEQIPKTGCPFSQNDSGCSKMF